MAPIGAPVCSGGRIQRDADNHLPTIIAQQAHQPLENRHGDHLPMDLTYIHSYIHTSIRLSIHTNIVQKQNSQCILHTYIHTYILTYIHTCMHTCIHAYIHIYVHAYINTCIHTYIHTQGPDGGIARLRVFGRIQTAPPTSNSFWADKEIDLAAVENGGLALVWSILLYTV